MDRIVFIDDSNPSIKYGGSWKALTGLSTSGPSAGIPGQGPLYGTMHVLDLQVTGVQQEWSISYEFNGTSIQAQFALSDVKAIKSCLVDNRPQTPSIDIPAAQRVQCGQNNIPPGGGPHELSITLQESNVPVLLDAIFLTPEPKVDLSTLNGDIQPQLDDESTKGNTSFFIPGDHIDIDFVGYSISLYAGMSQFLGNGTTSLSYTLDGGGKTTFVVSNPTTPQNPEILSQLIVQTPRLELGQHHFHMELLGPGEPGGTLLTFLLNRIIVQNTSAPAYPSLDAVPLVPLASVTSASSTSLSSTASGQPTSLLPPAVPAPKKDGHRIAAIVAPVAAVLVVAGLIFFLWYRRAKLHVSGRFSEQGNDSHLMPTPFPNDMLGGQRRQENRTLSPPVFHQDGSEIGDMPPSYHASSYEAADILRDPPRAGALSNPNRQGQMGEREKGVVLRGFVARGTSQEHRALGRTADKRR